MPDISPDILKKRHPEYDEFASDWEFFRSSYVGGSQWITDKNIFRHAREEQKDFESRLKMATYPNYCRPIIEIYTGFIYGSEQRIARQTNDNDDLEAFNKDVDFRKATMDDFMENVANNAQVFGHVGVLVDQPQPPLDRDGEPIPLSVADLQELNIRPYAVPYYPKDICDWSLDRFGAFNWVRLKERTRNDENPYSDEQKPATLYRTWTRQGWELHNEKGESLGEMTHGLGFVPFTICYFRRNSYKELVGISQLSDIARVNRLIPNIVSYIHSFLAKNAFPFLAATETGRGAEDETVISEQDIFEIPEGGDYPKYISPPTDPAQFMTMFIQEFLVREIYRMAKLEHRILSEQSGVAKQMDFHQTNNALVKFARNLEMTEQFIYHTRAAWLNEASENVSDYPDSFNIEALNDALDNALKTLDVFSAESPTFTSEFLKDFATRILPKLASDIKAMVDGELDEAAVARAQADAFQAETRAA